MGSSTSVLAREEMRKRSPSLLVISPAKDEARYIGRTIDSMIAQSHRPSLWIIVDDGSTDRTAEIAEEAAIQHPWIKVVRRRPGTERRVGPGVIEAFYEGLALANLDDYDFVCKLDADLEFGPEYFAECFHRFAENPRLGTFSGKAFIPEKGRLIPERTGDQFSMGCAKFYRRQCFEEIGGFVREVMWDGIDCHRCRMLGWEAASDHDPQLRILHLRPMGSSHRNIFHGRMRWGRGQYFMGTHPLYILGITAYRVFDRPRVLGGLCILAGYIDSWIHRRPRYEDAEFRRHLHRWQFAELKTRFGRLFHIGRRRQEHVEAVGQGS
jgi:glycosyltransferase involved in cell wall biosynthesis